MAEQDSKRLDPEEEKAQLLARVKSDNAEVAVMEQQIKEVAIQLERLQNELKEVDNVGQLFKFFIFMDLKYIFVYRRLTRVRVSEPKSTGIFENESRLWMNSSTHLTKIASPKRIV